MLIFGCRWYYNTPRDAENCHTSLTRGLDRLVCYRTDDNLNAYLRYSNLFVLVKYQYQIRVYFHWHCEFYCFRYCSWLNLCFTNACIHLFVTMKIDNRYWNKRPTSLNIHLSTTIAYSKTCREFHICIICSLILKNSWMTPHPHQAY